eukprot:719295-Rhodomonas_salina.1
MAHRKADSYKPADPDGSGGEGERERERGSLRGKLCGAEAHLTPRYSDRARTAFTTAWRCTAKLHGSTIPTDWRFSPHRPSGTVT